jgi:hypothetical protein
MSKKKTSTAESETSRPSIIPIMKTQGRTSKTKGKATGDTDQAKTNSTVTDSPLADAGQATADASQMTTPAPESPSADEATTPVATDLNAKANKKGKVNKEPKPKKVSALDAAAKVLTDAGTAMTTGKMIEAMAKKKLWSSPNGQTPAATLYSAIAREINTKGTASRFTKAERGKFAAKV